MNLERVTEYLDRSAWLARWVWIIGFPLVALEVYRGRGSVAVMVAVWMLVSGMNAIAMTKWRERSLGENAKERALTEKFQCCVILARGATASAYARRARALHLDNDPAVIATLVELFEAVATLPRPENAPDEVKTIQRTAASVVREGYKSVGGLH